MDKAQAVHSFWNRFGLIAYDESTVPDTAQMPYITYELATSSFSDGAVALSASLWYHTTSLEQITKKSEEISQYIGFGGITIHTDSGFIWIKRRSPFAQRMRDNTDDKVLRIILNISVEFIDY